MKDQKTSLKTYSMRDVMELSVLVCVLVMGFVLVFNATSPSLFCFTNCTQSNLLISGDTGLEESDFKNLGGSIDEQFENTENTERIHSTQNDKLNNFEPDVKSIFQNGNIETMTMESETNEESLPSSNQCDIIPENERINCHPEELAIPYTCNRRGCCWLEPNDTSTLSRQNGPPSCFYPRNYDGYRVLGTPVKTPSGVKVMLQRSTSSYYPETIMKLQMEVTYETDYRLRVKISDPAASRWEVPLSKPMTAQHGGIADNMYSVQVPGDNQPFSLIVTRKSTNTPILNTTEGFLFSDQFLQLPYLLPPSSSLYGLGEHRDTLRHSYNWTRYVFWNKDQPPVENSNLYGSHPFYLAIENDSSSHGVLLLNSNAMEVELQPAPALTWRTIGGVLDLYIFFGPTPGDVIRQYTELIGRPFLPPYWSLGFHLCRWGYPSAQVTQAIADKMSSVGMPQDTQWNDIDYMNKRKDFTTAPKFGSQRALADKLHSQGKHYIMIVDPSIAIDEPGSYKPFDLGMKMQIFINNSDDQPLVGFMWPGRSVWPDFSNPHSLHYWTTLVSDFYKDVAFDGLWIDMNDISNFVHGSMSGCSLYDKYEHPPYVPGKTFFGKPCRPAYPTQCAYKHGLCLKGSCTCSVGYSFNFTINKCDTECTEYGRIFSEYSDTAIEQCNLGDYHGNREISAEECQELCLKANFTCISAEWKPSTIFTPTYCNLCNITWYQLPQTWRQIGEYGFTLFYRHCRNH